MHQLEIHSFLPTTIMPAQSPKPAPCPRSEVVSLVLESMCLNNVQDDKYILLFFSMPGLIIIRSINAIKTFQHVARWIPQLISPFLDLNATLFATFPSDEL